MRISTAFVVLFVFIFNTTAFAFSNQTGAVSEQEQAMLQIRSRLKRNFDQMSDKKKIRVLSRTERRLQKLVDVLSKSKGDDQSDSSTLADTKVELEVGSFEDNELLSAQDQEALAKVKTEKTLDREKVVQNLKTSILYVQKEIVTLKDKIAGRKPEANRAIASACAGTIVVGALMIAAAVAASLIFPFGGVFVFCAMLSFIAGWTIWVASDPACSYS